MMIVTRNSCLLKLHVCFKFRSERNGRGFFRELLFSALSFSLCHEMTYNKSFYNERNLLKPNAKFNKQTKKCSHLKDT